MEIIGVPDDISKFLGFVYLTTDLTTGKKYIGQKSFWRIDKRNALQTRTKEEEKKRQKLQDKYNSGLIKTKKALAEQLRELTIKEKERRSKLLGKKRRVKVQTDWRNYYGSSEHLKEDIEEKGVENFKREIIWLCTGKWWLSYLELQEQLKANAIFRSDFHNGIINIRLSNVVPEKDFENQVKVFEPKY